MVSPWAPVPDIQALFALKANLIRYQTIVSPGDVSTDEWLSQTKQHVDYVKNYIVPLCTGRQRIVFDIHSPPGGLGPAPDYNALMFDADRQDLRNAHLDLWKYAAETFKDIRQVIAYDILNEPRTANQAQVNGYMQSMYDWVRLYDDKKHIVISPSYGDPANYRSFKPIVGTNLWYTLHFYITDRFTAQGIDGKPLGYHYPVQGFDKNRLKTYLKAARAFQLLNNVEFYVGEFSTSIYTPEKDACAYIGDLISIYEEYGWHWTFHAWREATVWNPERTPGFLKVLTTPWGKNKI